jgi:hypothetical protein
MGNLSTYTRSTEAGRVARRVKNNPDARKKFGVRTFGQALAKMFGLMKPTPPKVEAARDRKAERAARKPLAKVAARHVPKYRAAARPAHTRPGCKALRTIAT